MYFLWLNGNQAGPYSLEPLKAFWKEGQINARTPFWQDGMPDWKPLEIIQTFIAETSSARVIGGFWRRLVAYGVDSLLLAILGFVLGLLFFNYFARIGPWALLVGFSIALVYFGLLNSTMGRGRTLGKRLLGLEVIDRAGDHIAPVRSLLRYVIFALPFYAECGITSAGLTTTSPVGMIIGFMAVAMGGAIAYLYLFNRRTRQSLHDLAVGTYVVKTASTGPAQFPALWRGHWVALGVLFLMLVGLCSASLWLIHTSFFEKLLAAQKGILSTGNVSAVSVVEGVNWTYINGKSSSEKVLSINAHWKGKPADYDQAAKEIAGIVFKQYPDVVNDDALSITITTGYNIGIFSFSYSQRIPHSPQEWEKIVGPAN